MTGSIKPYRLGISALIGLSLAFTTMVATTASAGVHNPSRAHASKSANASRCKTRDKATGTIKFSDWQFPDNLNVFQTNSAASVEVLNGTQDTLTLFDQNAKLRPQLLATLPTIKNGGITNGGKTIALVLRKGADFSNGKQITAADVKFSWQVSMDKATGPFCLGTCDSIARIDTRGNYEVVLHMKSVYAAIIDAGLIWPIYPRVWPGGWSNDAHAAALKLGQDSSFNFEGANYPSTGAYQVSQWVTNDRIVLSPMKYYSDLNCGAYVKAVTFAFYSTKPAMIAAAASKQTDITQDYTSADLPELQKHTSAYRLSSIPSFFFEHLEFNLDSTYNGKPNPVADTKVRQALALALDKIGLIRSALGLTAAQAKNVVAWTPWVNTPTLVQPFANRKITGQWDPISKKFVQPGTASALVDARKLLAGTPYKDGFNVDFYTTSGNPVRQAAESVIASNWAKIGVKVVPNFVPGPAKLFAQWDQGGVLHRGTFQVAMFAFVGSPEPDTFKEEMQSKYCDHTAAVHTAVNNNDACIKDNLIDRDFDKAAGSFNSKVRASNYAAIQLELAKQGYWDNLYFRPQIATASKKVVNWSNNPTASGPTWNMFDYRAGTAS